MTQRLTTAAGAPVANNQDALTAGPRGPMLLQDIWFLEKLATSTVRLSRNAECTLKAPVLTVN